MIGIETGAFGIKQPCHEGLCLRGRDEERWQGDAGAVPGARQGSLSQSCPSALSNLPWEGKSLECKASGEAGRGENSQWCFLAPWPSTFASRPHPKHFHVCVCPLPRLLIFYMPDDSCIFGPLAFEEARKHYDFPMLKKRKENTFPPRCFILI